MSDRDNFTRHFNKILGKEFTEREINDFVKQIKIFKPTIGNLFWRSSEASIGIFFILSGKLRLLDSKDNLIVSLQEGFSFGELTLFARESWQAYSVRASVNLELAYLDEQFLNNLLKKYPELQERLYRQALLTDLLLVHHQTVRPEPEKLHRLLKILPFLERHELASGKLNLQLLKSQGLWLLRKGAILDPQGNKILPGKIYNLAQLPKKGNWTIEQPTELYLVDESHWQSIVQLLSAKEEQVKESPIANGQSIAITSLNNNDLVFNKPLKQTQSPSKPQVYFPSPRVRIGQWWRQAFHKYPFFEQQSASDCGVACLIMISRYWGKRFSVNQLRLLANVNRDGASLRGLVAAAESIGYAPRPVKGNFEALKKQKLPAIAHWEGNHYIVVYKVDRDRVLVGDPAIGIRHLRREEFIKGWSGYTLLLEPTTSLVKTPEAQSNFWRFLELLKPHWLLLLEILVSSIVIQLFGLVMPLFSQFLLDRVVVERSTNALIAIGTGLLIFSLFQILMSTLRRYLLYHTANRVDLALIVGFVAHTFRLPLGYFESRFVGDITSRIGENFKIRRFLTGEALTIILDLIFLFVYIGLMFWYSWQLALLAMIVIPIFILLAIIATPFLKKVSREIFNAKAIQDSYLIEALTGIGTIKSMGVERGVRWHWEDLFNKYIQANFTGQLVNQRLNLATSIIETFLSRFLLLFGIAQVIQQQMTIGQLIAFNMLVSQVISPFKRLLSLWNDFQEITIAIERINDVIEAQPEESPEINPRPPLPNLQGNIRFENVTFRYDPESDRNTLENLSFEVKPGQTVAIVGRSGSGKTTISKLILGLYQTIEGKISIDGYDINSIALQSLRRQVGVVDQDTFLFGGTIRENIALAHPGANLEDIRQAARLAGAEQFIETLPMKYETKIGEGGGMLSGGQRQRLAIARALLGNPRLLIFDEATSSLDTESERIIQNNLNTILKNRTTIIIAHRLSTVRNADLILVLDRGVLIESGDHDSLVAKRGQYFYLTQQQLAIA
jgi:ATP-binding cassette subfamily B protein